MGDNEKSYTSRRTKMTITYYLRRKQAAKLNAKYDCPFSIATHITDKTPGRKDYKILTLTSLKKSR